MQTGSDVPSSVDPPVEISIRWPSGTHPSDPHVSREPAGVDPFGMKDDQGVGLHDDELDLGVDEGKCLREQMIVESLACRAAFAGNTN